MSLYVVIFLAKYIEKSCLTSLWIVDTRLQELTRWYSVCMMWYKRAPDRHKMTPRGQWPIPVDPCTSSSKRKDEAWNSFSSTNLSADHLLGSERHPMTLNQVVMQWSGRKDVFVDPDSIGHSGKEFHKKDYQPTSWLPILTTTVNGNGDMPAASVIGGTTPLPRSDEVYVTKVWIVLTKVVVSVLLNVPSKEMQWMAGIYWYLGHQRRIIPNVPLGCRSSALIILWREFKRDSRRAKYVNWPLFPRNILLACIKPRFLCFLFRHSYDNLIWNKPRNEWEEGEGLDSLVLSY